MQNLRKGIIGGVAILGLVGTIYSFTITGGGDDDKNKKYEVIRVVDGEVTTYDTIISVNSTYTEQNYLNDLGFGDDENVSIINVMDEGMMNVTMNGEHNGDGKHKMILIEMDEDVSTDGTHNVEIKTTGDSDGVHEIIIEKTVIKNGEDGEMNVNIDIQGDIEGINIDSLMATIEGGEGQQVIVHKMIICDDSTKINGGLSEFHEIEMDDADFHRVIEDGDKHIELAMFGEETKDVTILIVSDPANESANKRVFMENNDATGLKVYPNPATKSTAIQMNFTDEANTVITITDVNGKTVETRKLGNVKGNLTEDLDIEKWSKGIYFVTVTHGNEKSIEKLIVE